MTAFHYLPALTWRGLFDILFLTVVVYQLYNWFRGTRALRALIGLAVLGGIYSLAKLWGLFLTTWAFQMLWQVLLILMLILFQSEIRQVLEKVSPLRYLKRRRRHSQDLPPDNLAEVAFHMAEERTGALIVITRDDDPSEFLLAGQRIMALPEPTLIRSIFDHHGPSHDGALIMRENRLTQMGCILPLSAREDIPAHFGTRHRAALGLSEKTDAICLIVSEERGQVSTAVEGRINVWKQQESLCAYMKEMLAKPVMPRLAFRSFFKEAVTRNRGVKLGILTLVTLAWILLAGHQELTLSVTAPIGYVNTPAGLTLADGSARAVQLKLSGRSQSVGALGNKKIKVKVNLGFMPRGTHLMKLSPMNFDLPLGITVDRILPQEIRVILEPEKGSASP